MYAWVTARRIKDGKMEEFKKAWESGPRLLLQDKSSGLRKVYYLQDVRNPNLMIGVAIWDSEDAFDRYASSSTEAHRKQAMDEFVEAVEWERFFRVEEY